MRTTLSRLEAIKDLVQEAIDKGATSVEQIHRAIADLPFAALERGGLLREPKPREVVGQSIGVVYDAIRRVNSEVGGLVTGLFESLDDHADAQTTLSRKQLSEALDTAFDKEAATLEPKGKKANKRRKS
ncbi:MAG: hypothetical protein ACRETN_14245 [Nevskiales bacterium]